MYPAQPRPQPIASEVVQERQGMAPTQALICESLTTACRCFWCPGGSGFFFGPSVTLHLALIGTLTSLGSLCLLVLFAVDGSLKPPWFRVPKQRRGHTPYGTMSSDPQCWLGCVIECPCQHPSCFWEKARKLMKIRATTTHPATAFFTMADSTH